MSGENAVLLSLDVSASIFFLVVYVFHLYPYIFLFCPSKSIKFGKAEMYILDRWLTSVRHRYKNKIER